MSATIISAEGRLIFAAWSESMDFGAISEKALKRFAADFQMAIGL